MEDEERREELEERREEERRREAHENKKTLEKTKKNKKTKKPQKKTVLFRTTPTFRKDRFLLQVNKIITPVHSIHKNILLQKNQQTSNS